ncbi:DUF1631 family protein [Porticoccus sp. W117]|uniref:DUF1631 family protein n=1 Tax=Porticoccus sp. W117 TaxID=3054777 RepID=UPI0025961BD4|nr:DUF1631 family protein [Porticoccus sp. W117]MDM3871063.1 DUF1631 family protein [Porticoccus sp. W117]
MAEGHLHIVKNGTTLQQRQSGVLPPPLRMLRDRAERHFGARLKAVFEQVDDTFFDLADRSDNSRQQTLYFDAMRLIRFERKNIESGFQNSLELAFDSLVDAEAAERRQQRQQKNTAFELADGEELEEIIALDAMVSRADEGNRQQLQVLATRLESLTGASVSLKDNPLGPDTVCDTFFRATADLDIGIRSKLVLLKLFERHVVSPLGDFLSQSNQLLQELGVLPDLEKRQGAEAQPIRTQLQKQPVENGRHPGDFLDRDSLQQQQKNYGRLVSQLNTVMARHWQQGDEENNGKLPELPEAAPAEVLKAVGQLEVSGVSSLLERIQQQLANGDHPMSLGSTERGLVHLVDGLFDHICADMSFPPTLEAQMAELQIAIAKAALSDSGFFDKQRHPARRLFNEIVQAAQGFTDSEDLDNDPLYPHIDQALQQLLGCASSPVRLTQALTELVSVTEKQRRQALSREQHLLEDEQASSQLHHSYNAVKQLLHDGMVGRIVPKVVVTFAEQAWCKVLFLNHLREGAESAQWRRAKAMFEQVLECCGGNGGAEETSGVELAANIRSKLAEIALDPYQTEHLVRDLEKLLTTESSARDSEADAVAVEQVYPAIPGEQKTLMPGDALPDMKQLGDTIEEHFLHDAESIPAGCWVEFSTPRGGLRARYIGAAGPQNIHIFVDRQGHKVAAGNSRQLAHLLKNNQLVIIDNSPLFDRALAAVIDTMRQQ